jgi:hypothetical protein
MRIGIVLLVMLSGCECNHQPEPVPVKHQRDCVNDPFDYSFYASEDQKALTYCYAVLQTMAREKREGVR